MLDFHFLAQGAVVAIENQNFIFGCDDGVPVGALGKTFGVRAIRQRDAARQWHWIFNRLNYIRHTDDNQDDDGYKTGNHRPRQDDNKDSEEH